MTPTTRRTLKSVYLIAAAALLTCAPTTALACPNCVDATEEKTRTMQSEGDGTNLAQGFSASVIFMILIPYTLVGGFGYALYRTHQARASHPHELLPPPTQD